MYKQLATITTSAVNFDSFLCVQKVTEVYKQYQLDLVKGPSIQYYMEYEAEEIGLSCYCEAKKIIDVSTYCETMKWHVVDDCIPLQVWIINFSNY